MGYASLDSNTSGCCNTGVGYGALGANTTASGNTAFGALSLEGNTTGPSNTALGMCAGYSTTTGGYNTYLGERAGVCASTVSNNVFVGHYAGFCTTSGCNTFVGTNSAYLITGGANTVIGSFSGNQCGLDIRTASNNIVLSDGSGRPRLHINSTGQSIQTYGNDADAYVGHTSPEGVHSFQVNQNNTTWGGGVLQAVFRGNRTNTPLFTAWHTASGRTASPILEMQVLSDGDLENTNNSYGAISDERLKENIVDSASQWDDIKALQVRNYNFKAETGHNTHTQLGVIAQEVELVSPALVKNHAIIDADGNETEEVTKSVKYSVLYMKAVKALQEAMDRIETLEAKVTALENT
jgi:hypothetical protein